MSILEALSKPGNLPVPGREISGRDLSRSGNIRSGFVRSGNIEIGKCPSGNVDREKSNREMGAFQKFPPMHTRTLIFSPEKKSSAAQLC